MINAIVWALVLLATFAFGVLVGVDVDRARGLADAYIALLLIAATFLTYHAERTHRERARH